MEGQAAGWGWRRDTLAAVAFRWSIHAVGVFGSVRRPHYDPRRSDLDVLVVADQPPDEFGESACAALQEAVESCFVHPRVDVQLLLLGPGGRPGTAGLSPGTIARHILSNVAWISVTPGWDPAQLAPWQAPATWSPAGAADVALAWLQRHPSQPLTPSVFRAEGLPEQALAISRLWTPSGPEGWRLDGEGWAQSVDLHPLRQGVLRSWRVRYVPAVPMRVPRASSPSPSAGCVH